MRVIAPAKLSDPSTPPNLFACRCPRGLVAHGCVPGAGMQHLRYSATPAHALVRCNPGGKSRFRLNPMSNRSLVAPVQQTRHGLLMRACGHEGEHALLAVPGRHRPECPATVSQQRAILKPGRLLHLIERAQSVNRKERNETNRPDSKPRQADEGHSFCNRGVSVPQLGRARP